MELMNASFDEKTRELTTRSRWGAFGRLRDPDALAF
jgi:hypothetical protein